MTIPTTRVAITASMPADPEAFHRPDEVASESFLRAFPSTDALCAGTPPDWEWVPDREAAVVPDEMAATCRSCPGRQACLLWALGADEAGYWAGTTDKDRENMRQTGQTSVHTADWLQDLAAAAALASAGTPLHALGEGSYSWYRTRGCRCLECRSANTSRRACERARARCRTTP